MLEIPEKLLSLLLYGFVLGLAVVAFYFLYRWFSRRRGEESHLDPALLIPVAFLMREMTLRQVPWFAWIGVLLLCISEIIKNGIALRLFLLITGALFLAFWSIQDWWLRGIVVFLTLWFSKSFSAFTGLFWLLLPVSMAGILSTVPDTEDVALLLGILIPAMLFARFRVSAHTGITALAGIVAWVICSNGQGRPASIVVSIGCLGLLMTFPFIQMVRKVTPPTFLGILLQILSVTIVLHFARTTPHIDQAILASVAALAMTFFIVATFVSHDLKSIEE